MRLGTYFSDYMNMVRENTAGYFVMKVNEMTSMYL